MMNELRMNKFNNLHYLTPWYLEGNVRGFKNMNAQTDHAHPISYLFSYVAYVFLSAQYKDCDVLKIHLFTFISSLSHFDLDKKSEVKS